MVRQVRSQLGRAHYTRPDGERQIRGERAVFHKGRRSPILVQGYATAALSRTESAHGLNRLRRGVVAGEVGDSGFDVGGRGRRR